MPITLSSVFCCYFTKDSEGTHPAFPQPPVLAHPLAIRPDAPAAPDSAPTQSNGSTGANPPDQTKAVKRSGADRAIASVLSSSPAHEQATADRIRGLLSRPQITGKELRAARKKLTAAQSLQEPNLSQKEAERLRDLEEKASAAGQPRKPDESQAVSARPQDAKSAAAGPSQNGSSQNGSSQNGPSQNGPSQKPAKSEKMVTGVLLGPIDSKGAAFRRHRRDTPYGFTNMVVQMRKGLVELKFSISNGVPDSDPNYARRSMDDWAYRTHGIVAGNPNAHAYIHDVARTLYDNWRAIPEPDQREDKMQDARATFKSLKKLGRKSKTTTVRIYDQVSELRPSKVLREKGEAYALYTFAYRMNPVKRRNANKGAGRSRIALNFEASEGAAFAKRIVKVVKKNPSVYQSKIMGPALVGERTDDAIVYMLSFSLDDAERIAELLSEGTKDLSLPATPPGMERIGPRASYAESKWTDSSSHGNSRIVMVTEVVKAKLEDNSGKAKTSDVMRESLDRHGYDPEQPSRLKRS